MALRFQHEVNEKIITPSTSNSSKTELSNIKDQFSEIEKKLVDS